MAEIEGQQQNQISSEEIPRAIFNEVDTDNDGLISQEQTADLLKKISKEMTEEQIAEFFLQADKDQDGKISFEEVKPLFHDPVIPAQA